MGTRNACDPFGTLSQQTLSKRMVVVFAGANAALWDATLAREARFGSISSFDPSANPSASREVRIDL